ADVRIRNSLKEGFHYHQAILPQTAAVSLLQLQRHSNGPAADQRIYVERFGNCHTVLPKQTCMHTGISTIFGSCWRSSFCCHETREMNFADMILLCGAI